MNTHLIAAGQRLPGSWAVLTLAEPRPWHEIPGVRLLGAVLGTLLLFAAIRAMFGGGRK